MDRGWETIKSVIDRSDYYVLILAGRYGSVYRRGKSWTEKEYEYAVLRNIPVLAFIRAKRSIRADAMDEDSGLRAILFT
jgi:transketolase C-terminal domain/subunit